MTHRQYTYTLLMLLLLVVCPHMAHAQEEQEFMTPEEELAMSQQVQLYMQRVEKALVLAPNARACDVATLSRNAKAIETQWQFYMQTIQPYLSESDTLMSMAALMQDQIEELNDSIQAIRQRASQVEAFHAAAAYIHAQLSIYLDMKKRATALSLTPKTAQALADLKQREQLTLADIDQRYAQAKEGLAASPQLKKKMQAVEDDYIHIRQASQYIQAQEYVTIKERIKQALPIAAYTAILLMALNMVHTKIKAARAMKKQMDTLMGKMDKNGQPIPEI